MKRFILAALLPILITGFLSYFYLSRKITGDIQEKNQLIAQAIVGEISSVLKEPLTILQQVKFLIQTHEHINGELDSTLDYTVRHSKFFESIFILNAEKQIVNLGLPDNSGHLRANLMGVDYSGMDLFRTGGKPKEIRWSQTYLSSLTGHKSLDLALSLPEGRTLGASFSIEHIREVLMGRTRNAELVVFIADTRGNLIFHPDKTLVRAHMNFSNILPLAKALKGEYGTFAFSMNNQAYIGSTARVQNLGWPLVVAQTRAKAQAPLRELRIYLGGALLVALVLVIMLALDTAQTLLHPLYMFRESIIALGKGKDDAPLPTQPHIELESLAERFRQMARAIKKRERELQISEDKFRSIFENTPLGVVHYNEKGVVATCNERAAEVFGSSVESVTGFDGLRENRSPLLINAIESALAGRKNHFTDTYVSVTGNRTASLSVHFGPIRLESGTVAGAIGVFEDITAQKEMEEQTRKSEEKFKVIFESANDGILVADPATGMAIMGNEKFSAMVRRRQDDITGMDISTILRDTRDISELSLSATEGGTPLLLEVPLTRKDGSRIHTEVNAARIEVDGRDHFIGFFRDISQRIRAEKEKEKLETQLRQALKMEAIGTMAGGIAHDFNNILGIIIGNTELALDDLPQWTPSRTFLDEIKTAGMRAKDLVRQLLSFSRKTEQSATTPINIREIFEESVRLLRASTPSYIELTTEAGRDLSLINADPTQIQQVIINLATNAIHAMEDSPGILGLKLKEIELTETTFKGFKTLPAGNYIQLSISDTGHGVDPAIFDKIFDPYFTTKEVGKGTGMGLSVVHGIVSSHDGALTLYTEPGKGSVFRILFPTVKAVPVRKPELETDIPEGTGHILFVDDEASLVRMAVHMLEKLGYTVTAFTNPSDALEFFAKAPDTIDLVITDMTMPVITGEILALKLMEIREDLPVILCTGFSARLEQEGGLPPGIKKIIEKPVSARLLAKTVEEVLKPDR